jgi:predicted ATPase
MITSLSLERFKSWREIDSMRLEPITGLFGTNSSGKTSILQWLLLMKQTVNSADRQQVLNLGDDKDPVRLGTFRDIVYRHDINSTIAWQLSWTMPTELKVADPERKNAVLFSGNSMAFASRVGYAQNQAFVDCMRYQFDDYSFHYRPKPGTSQKKKAAYTLEVDGPPGFKFKRSQGRPWDLPGPVKCYGFPDQVNSYFQNAGFLTDFQLAFEELFNRVYYLGPLRDYPRRQYTWGGAQPADMGERGEKVVDALLASRTRGEKISRGKGRPKLSVEEYTAYWLKKLGLIAEFRVEPVAKGSNIFQVLVQKTPDSAPVLITDVGFGISQILPVIVLCYYVPPGSTVVLEQPEIHLHPSVQSGLADVFIDAVKVNKIQLVIESHSEHLLRRLQRRIAEEQLPRDDVALYFCRYDEDASSLDRLEVDLYGSITNWPRDFFGDELGEMAAMTRAAMERRRGGTA